MGRVLDEACAGPRAASVQQTFCAKRSLDVVLSQSLRGDNLSSPGLVSA